MKDFPFWRGAIFNAKTAFILKVVGEDLARFQSQSDFLGDEPKLTVPQVISLRKSYAEKMDKFNKETMPGNPADKPKFNK